MIRNVQDVASTCWKIYFHHLQSLSSCCKNFKQR